MDKTLRFVEYNITHALICDLRPILELFSTSTSIYIISFTKLLKSRI